MIIETKENEVRYQISNTYSTLFEPSKEGKQIWFVCHGLGHLSRYFIKYFSDLDPDRNYIIAPQASAKYYLNTEYNRVGASWLTKERTADEIENVLSYFDRIHEAESIDPGNLVVLGFSQGVSVALRWIVRRKIPCRKLIMYAGRAPHELKSEDLQFLLSAGTQVYYVYGVDDPYITAELMHTEKQRLDHLFAGQVEYVSFGGGHHIDSSVIRLISQL